MTDREAMTVTEGRVAVRSVPLGGSALSRAVQRGSVGASWYAPRPQNAAAWSAHVGAVRASMGETDWLTPLAPAIAATGLAADRLTRAAAQGAVITTGQQPGLFGGPAYTFSKALSALAMADELEQRTGISIAPLFWAATDDADWMEAAVTHVATSAGLQTLSLTGSATDGIAMADVMLGELREARETLAAACGSAAQSEVLTLVDSAYVPHATIGASYVQLLRALLEPLGIAVLDAAHAAVRTAADPFLRRALVRAGDLSAALTQRGREISDAGFAPQVDVVDSLSLVFRTSLVQRDAQMVRARERVPITDAARVAREADVGALGANVLLRPVLERSLLPTVCYLAGPGELAYFAQVAPIASALGASIPLVAPRWSGEIVEADAERAIDRLGISEAMLSDPHAAELAVARRLMSDDVNDSLERLRVMLETQLLSLKENVGGADGVVADSVVDGLQRDLGHRLDRFERRALAGVKRREVQAMRDVAAARAKLRPLGQSPERVLNLVPMLARYGVEILEQMRDGARQHAQRLVHGDTDRHE